MSNPTVAYSGECLISAGIGQVVIARFKYDGRIEIGASLVDVFCLSVKHPFSPGPRTALQPLMRTNPEKQFPWRQPKP